MKRSLLPVKKRLKRKQLLLLLFASILSHVSFVATAQELALLKNADNGAPGSSGTSLRLPELTLNDLLQVGISGTVTDMTTGEGLPGVNVIVKGTANGTITDIEGKYSLTGLSTGDVIVFSYIGYTSEEVTLSNQSTINLAMNQDIQSLQEVIVIGYGEKRKESITAAVSSITSKDIEKVHGGATVSTGLAGKIPGVTFRMAEGRPGASASVQIRNMGDPLFVIDGIQQDAGQFNNLAPQDIESITVLKDASAAIYGLRAANGVVLVTTKRGRLGSGNTVNIDANYGLQNWTRFPKTVDAYRWQLGKVEADMNQRGETNMTREELARWEAGEEYGYRNFDWYDFIIKENSPLASVNINATGGSDKVTYYLSATKLSQTSVLGREFTFDRTNIQSNVSAQITESLKVGVQINGRIEHRENPGVPGGDDYWAPRFALLRNLPFERPFANDNPNYLNDIGHNAENWGLLNKRLSGYLKNTWRVLQTNFDVEYKIPGIKGLTASGKYSYYIADRVQDVHEYTYDAYTYRPDTDTYERTGGSDNPWRERRLEKIFNEVSQIQVNYANKFGKHDIAATFVNERIARRETGGMQHANPTNNFLPNMYFANNDDRDYSDYDNPQARIGYVGRMSYGYDDKYFVELSGRRDASWLFMPGKRVGYFPSASAGWRISEEGFFQNWMGGNQAINELKLRFSYGQLGDDNQGVLGIRPFDYLEAYNYNTSKAIMNGNVVLGARDRGIPVRNISWFTSTIADVGLDFTIMKNKLSGSIDYFNRQRKGLPQAKNDVLLPAEIGYGLPAENLNSDAVIGGEFSLAYYGKAGELEFSVAGNVSYARSRLVDRYNPIYGNSLDHYYNGREDRWNNILWGYEVTGQFQSEEEIHNHAVNIDGNGNRTLLPGDLIFKDQNNDGIIDGNDRRPIGYAADRNPIVNTGLNLTANYKGFDFTADFSGGSMYSNQLRWEMLWPYQNQGNLLARYEDRWHRADPFSLDSEWIPGKYPALRFNDGGHSNFRNGDVASTFFTRNVRYLRARTIEIGYSLPQSLLERVKIKKARFYVNTFNLFSFDNMKDLEIEPEIIDPNGLQYPQNRIMNFGVNLSL